MLYSSVVVKMAADYKLLSKFSVVPVDKFEGDCPYFRQPKQVGCFSLDEERLFLDNDSRLRYYSPPEIVNFDLRVGYREFIRRDEEKNDRLDDMLRWIKKHPEKFELSGGTNSKNDGSQSSLHTDFVTWRGHMTKILCTPYERKEPWQMAVSLNKGTIYISEVETVEARQRRLNQSERQDQMCYWGYKFEDYVTSPREPAKCKRIDEPINNNEAFCSVVRCRLDKHSMVFGAEVDCCVRNNCKNSSPPLNYIELKTSRTVENDRMQWSFERYKLLKWWAQSFLAGIPKVVCGFRNDDGVVKKLKTFNTLEIPSSVVESQNTWTGSVCLNFCNRMLAWVKSVVKDEDVVYMLHWREPFTHIELELSKREDDVFLRDWYLTR